jgi:hypothetical protein
MSERNEYKPHDYWPDYQAMGDCVTCGNMREDCERFKAEYVASLREAPAVEQENG